MMILTKIYVNDRLPMIPTTCNVNKLKKLTVQHQPILKNDALHSNQVVGMGRFRCWLEASFLCSTGLLLLCFFFRWNRRVDMAYRNGVNVRTGLFHFLLQQLKQQQQQELNP